MIDPVLIMLDELRHNSTKIPVKIIVSLETDTQIKANPDVWRYLEHKNPGTKLAGLAYEANANLPANSWIMLDADNNPVLHYFPKQDKGT